MNETSLNTTALEDVKRTLPLLEQIDNMCNEVNNLDQHNMALLAADTSQKTKKGSTLALVATVISYAVLNTLYYLLGRIGLLRGALIPIYIVCAFIACFVVYRKVKSGIVNSATHNATVEANNRRIEEISEMLVDLADGGNKIITLLPRDYRYYSAALFFEKALANGQADSMKEAITLYEEHLHRQKLDNMNQQRLYMEQRQAVMLSNIEANSASAARGAGTAAAFSILNYLR